MSLEIQEAAASLARRGMSVITVHGIKDDGTCTCGNPNCDRPGKHPRGKWRGRCVNAATPDIVEREFERAPDSNVGIVTGAVSRVIVIDVDSDEGRRALENAWGLKEGQLPLAPTVKTGGGGWHIYARWPGVERAPRTGVRILPGVDIRAEGAFVVAPPSLHSSGTAYEWLPGRSLDEVEIPDIDFTPFLQDQRGARAAESISPGEPTTWFDTALLQGTPPGGRNDMAARLAGRYFSLGLSRPEAKVLLDAWNSRSASPLDEAELTTVIDSILHREEGSLPPPNREQELEALSSLLGNGVRLTDVRRITGEPAVYELTFEQGSATASVTQLLSPAGLRNVVAEATKIVIRKRSSGTIPSHEQVAQRIMAVARDVDTGPEGNTSGETEYYLRLYLRETPAETEEIPPRGVFHRDGHAWFSLEDFCRHLTARWRINMPLRQAAGRLGAAGVERRTFRTSDGRSRVVWGMSLEKLRGADD